MYPIFEFLRDKVLYNILRFIMGEVDITGAEYYLGFYVVASIYQIGYIFAYFYFARKYHHVAAKDLVNLIFLLLSGLTNAWASFFYNEHIYNSSTIGRSYCIFIGYFLQHLFGSTLWFYCLWNRLIKFGSVFYFSKENTVCDGCCKCFCNASMTYLCCYHYYEREAYNALPSDTERCLSIMCCCVDPHVQKPKLSKKTGIFVDGIELEELSISTLGESFGKRVNDEHEERQVKALKLARRKMCYNTLTLFFFLISFVPTLVFIVSAYVSGDDSIKVIDEEGICTTDSTWKQVFIGIHLFYLASILLTLTLIPRYIKNKFLDESKALWQTCIFATLVFLAKVWFAFQDLFNQPKYAHAFDCILMLLYCFTVTRIFGPNIVKAFIGDEEYERTFVCTTIGGDGELDYFRRLIENMPMANAFVKYCRSFHWRASVVVLNKDEDSTAQYDVKVGSICDKLQLLIDMEIKLASGIGGDEVYQDYLSFKKEYASTVYEDIVSSVPPRNAASKFPDLYSPAELRSGIFKSIIAVFIYPLYNTYGKAFSVDESHKIHFSEKYEADRRRGMLDYTCISGCWGKKMYNELEPLSKRVQECDGGEEEDLTIIVSGGNRGVVKEAINTAVSNLKTGVRLTKNIVRGKKNKALELTEASGSDEEELRTNKTRGSEVMAHITIMENSGSEEITIASNLGNDKNS